MKLHHLALGAHDVARVAAFYEDVFSLPELKRFHHDNGELRSIWLDMDGVVLMVERTEDDTREVKGVGAGPFLLAFQVDAPQHNAFREALAERALEIEDETEYTTYFRDPEGNRVALSHYPGDDG